MPSCWAASSSAVAARTVDTRQSCRSSAPWYTAAVVWVLPTSMASSVTRRSSLFRDLRGVALEDLHGHVLGRVDLDPRDDPGGAVLVPDPHVLHRDVEERVGRLRHEVPLELVAQVRRLLREHAVAEEREDVGVLALQPQLELGVVLLELVGVGHRTSRAGTDDR